MRRYSPLLMILALLAALGVSQVATAAAAQPTATSSAFSLSSPSALLAAPPEAEEEEGEEAEGEVEEVEFEVEEEVLLEECESATDEFEFEDAAEEKEFEEEVAECEKEAKKGKSASFVSAVGSVTCWMVSCPGAKITRVSLPLFSNGVKAGQSSIHILGLGIRPTSIEVGPIVFGPRVTTAVPLDTAASIGARPV